MDGVETEPLAAADTQAHGRRAAWPWARFSAGMTAWGMPAAIAGVLASLPLATIVGASILIANKQTEVARLSNAVAPKIAAAEQHRVAHAALRNIVERPALGVVLEGFARGLPSEASLWHVERDTEGALEAQVQGGDPDALRAAIRREPTLSTMRNTNQRQTESGMIITMRREAR